MNTFIRNSILILAFAFDTVIAQNDETTVGKAFAGVKVITINTTGGTIELGRNNSGIVQVTVEFNLDKKIYHPMFEQKDSVLFLKEDFVFKPTGTAKSTWQVNIPDGLMIKYSSDAGDLNVTDLRVSILASSASGNFTWKNVNGNSTITSPEGDIEIENYQGNIGIKGRSGNVSISKYSGNLEINTGPGDVTLTEVTGSIFVTTGSGSIQAERVSLTQKSSFTSVSGAAELWLGAPVNHDLAISTTSGPAILHCKGMKLGGVLTMTANKKSGGIKSSFVLGKREEIKDDASGALRIRNTVQLGSSGNVIRVSTESGVVVVKK